MNFAFSGSYNKPIFFYSDSKLDNNMQNKFNNDYALLIGTRKGAFVLKPDLASQTTAVRWTISKPIKLGHIINHFVCDPRDKNIVLMAGKTGHLGPTMFWSKDGGTTFQESKQPPAFKQASDASQEKAVDKTFWLSPGHASEPGTWYAGTAPPGLFTSQDNGDSWQPVSGFNDNEMYHEWTGPGGGTPDGQVLHSIIIDPRDKNHMYIAVSSGGIFESLDKGKSWHPLNNGVAAEFLPNPNAEFGHDPHCVVMHPSNNDVMYHQNHCGIYKVIRPANNWIRIGNNMPSDIGDVGFPIVVHPGNPDTAFVFPMDGTGVWPRTSPEGKPAVYATKDGGTTWQRKDKGLPAENAYFTVKRQAMIGDSKTPFAIYFGTTCGEVWASFDEGESWHCLVRHLPEIYSLNIRN